MIKSQGCRCSLTGRKLAPDDYQLDHKVPFGEGGTDCVENIHAVCSEANAAKGTMSLNDFVSLCCEVADKARGQATLEPINDPKLDEAIELTGEGRSKAIRNANSERLAIARQASGAKGLTERQLHVCQAIVESEGSPTAAGRILALSPKTVREHIDAVRVKLSVKMEATS